MKTCKRCQQDKPEAAFYFDKSYPDGLQNRCKLCVQEHRKLKKLGALALPPPGHKTCSGCKLNKPLADFWADKSNKTDGRYSHCKACKTAATYKWRSENKEKYNETARKHNKMRYPEARLQRYGVTKAQHDTMLAAQKGVCAICSKLPKGKRPLVVDHSHHTGAVRGLLCYGCNRALHVLETTELLEKAMSYLDKHNK